MGFRTLSRGEYESRLRESKSFEEQLAAKDKEIERLQEEIKGLDLRIEEDRYG